MKLILGLAAASLTDKSIRERFCPPKVKLLPGLGEDLLEDLRQNETAAKEAFFLFPYFFIFPLFERTARGKLQQKPKFSYPVLQETTNSSLYISA